MMMIEQYGGGDIDYSYPGTRSTQSPQPLDLLKIERMPCCVPTTVFSPPRIGTIDKSSSS